MKAISKYILGCLASILFVGCIEAELVDSQSDAVTIEASMEVDVDTKTVTVTFDPSKTNNEALVKAFAKVKIEAAPMDACQGECCGHHHDAQPKQGEAKCEDDCCSDHGHSHDHGHGHSHKH